MTIGQRVVAATLTIAWHLALFVPTIGEGFGILEGDFAPQAEAIENGDLPYADQKLEYPPLSFVVLQAPALFGDGTDAYVRAFQWEMLLFDLAIILVLALALTGSAKRVISALVIYTLGLLALSGVLLDDSVIDAGPLWLARFDLVPALLVLGAVLARERERSATWSALLSAGAAVKAFPLALYPALLRGERDPRRVIYGALAALAYSVGVVIAIGDSPGSAVGYHTERGLQFESLFATPFELASLFGPGVAVVPSAGGYDIEATGTDAARWLTILTGLACYLLVLVSGWRARTPHMRLATALLAVMVAFGPVLSPQFLIWLLPISAAAFGFGRENVLLLVALVFTQFSLQYFGQALNGLESSWVWRIAVRNGALLAYLWVVCAPIVRAGALWRAPGQARVTAPQPGRRAA